MAFFITEPYIDICYCRLFTHCNTLELSQNGEGFTSLKELKKIIDRF